MRMEKTTNANVKVERSSCDTGMEPIKKRTSSRVRGGEERRGGRDFKNKRQPCVLVHFAPDVFQFQLLLLQDTPEKRNLLLAF